jgi:ribosome-binding protein aMBF1 (putative translation factor)
MKPTQFREARRKLGLSHAELARALKVAPQTVRRYAAEPERASHRPVPPIVAELMRRLLAERAT